MKNRESGRVGFLRAGVRQSRPARGGLTPSRERVDERLKEELLQRSRRSKTDGSLRDERWQQLLCFARCSGAPAPFLGGDGFPREFRPSDEGGIPTRRDLR
jgi:hypothetical protein